MQIKETTPPNRRSAKQTQESCNDQAEEGHYFKQKTIISIVHTCPVAEGSSDASGPLPNRRPRDSHAAGEQMSG